MSCLQCFLSSTISFVMFNFFMSFSTTLLQVFFGLPTGLLPSTSSSITLLSMVFSSLRFTWSNHLNLIFLNLCSRFSTPHLFLASSLEILSYTILLLTFFLILKSISKNKKKLNSVLNRKVVDINPSQVSPNHTLALIYWSRKGGKLSRLWPKLKDHTNFQLFLLSVELDRFY